jgi:hypothetical protein
MHELISHPGLQFYILRLSGTLTYTLTAAGRPPRVFELHEADFEDAEGLIKDEESVSLQGTDASAVGLKLTLVKNIGHLEMKYAGGSGGSANWTFKGLKQIGLVSSMYATAGAQTSMARMVDSEMQTSMAKMVESGMQTRSSVSTDSATQSDLIPTEPVYVGIDPTVAALERAAMVNAGTTTEVTMPHWAAVRYEYQRKFDQKKQVHT